MPYRRVPIVTNEIYHVFNRGIDRKQTFTDKRELQRAINVIKFYRFVSPPVKLSRFLLLPLDEQISIMDKQLQTNNKLVDIFSFCLMPNHFHFLLRQKVDRGISIFISQFQNSFTRYFNTKHERDGPLFLDQFKSVRIETDEQFLHVSRYVNINPLTSYVVKNFEDLIECPWSSLSEYINKEPLICETGVILDFFGKTNQQNKYLNFNKDQVNYQGELHKIEQLILE